LEKLIFPSLLSILTEEISFPIKLKTNIFSKSSSLLCTTFDYFKHCVKGEISLSVSWCATRPVY